MHIQVLGPFLLFFFSSLPPFFVASSSNFCRSLSLSALLVISRQLLKEKKTSTFHSSSRAQDKNAHSSIWLLKRQTQGGFFFSSFLLPFFSFVRAVGKRGRDVKEDFLQFRLTRLLQRRRVCGYGSSSSFSSFLLLFLLLLLLRNYAYLQAREREECLFLLG